MGGGDNGGGGGLLGVTFNPFPQMEQHSPFKLMKASCLAAIVKPTIGHELVPPLPSFPK